MTRGGVTRIGRYEVVGRIASGGMADVSLGRLRGPHGFERPVVIKRILPHLAADPRFVEMFLDEARLIASLRHPNLIHVYDLSLEDGELFMVMEFLEGESLAGLCRRLAARERFLDYELAAHIIAEACAGLHAAHETKSASGQPLGIVHRDVSPQNIFVSYSGAVHVIDFGIATSIAREGRTETGTVRGKTEYLAPEQIHADKLDRRADVFALGIVLLELASGRRVYKRASPAAAMMAILNEPAPKLSELRSGAPEELEQIATRALAKRRRDRYQSALEMRRALLSFMRKGTDADLGERLGALMQELFADRAAEKSALLRSVERGDQVETMPAAEVDPNVELPTWREANFASDSVSVPAKSSATRRARLGALAALLFIAIAAIAVTLTRPLWQRPVPPIEAARTEPDRVVVSAAATSASSATEVLPVIATPSASAAAPVSSPRARTRTSRPAPSASARTKPVPTMW